MCYYGFTLYKALPQAQHKALFHNHIILSSSQGLTPPLQPREAGVCHAFCRPTAPFRLLWAFSPQTLHYPPQSKKSRQTPLGISELFSLTAQKHTKEKFVKLLTHQDSKGKI
jgi:hypothetical protein